MFIKLLHISVQFLRTKHFQIQRTKELQFQTSAQERRLKTTDLICPLGRVQDFNEEGSVYIFRTIQLSYTFQQTYYHFLQNLSPVLSLFNRNPRPSPLDFSCDVSRSKSWFSPYN